MVECRDCFKKYIIKWGLIYVQQHLINYAVILQQSVHEFIVSPTFAGNSWNGSSQGASPPNQGEFHAD